MIDQLRLEAQLRDLLQRADEAKAGAEMAIQYNDTFKAAQLRQKADKLERQACALDPNKLASVWEER